jgi:hypothetical protein
MAHYKVTFPSGASDTVEADSPDHARMVAQQAPYTVTPSECAVEEIEVWREIDEPIQ